mgnify:CR=1 FL=1
MPALCLIRCLPIAASLTIRGLLPGCAEDVPPVTESLSSVRTITVAELVDSQGWLRPPVSPASASKSPEG